MRSDNMEKKHTKTPKEKRRNMERRKEKSRDAARCRRGRETEIFSDLSALLPIPASKVAHLDKASVIRVAISYLKIRDVVNSLPAIKEEKETEVEAFEGCNMDSLFVDSIEGFLLVTTTEGDIVFISESVNRYLGLQQVEVLGQSIYELSHPCDHAEIKEMLSTKDPKAQKSYFLRMKWSPKGRSVNMNKSTQYKVIHYTGRLIPSKFLCIENKNAVNSEDSDSGDSKQAVAKTTTYHFVGIGEAIWHPANIEIPLGRNTFLSKHSLDMKYTYADERIVEFFGYNPEALIKKSIYDYHHAQDTVVIKNCFKNLFEKGQSQTERYRFLALGGGYAWVVTQSTLIYNNNQKPLSVVCVNFIVSEIENKNEIYSLCQLDTAYTPLTSVDSPSSIATAAPTTTATTSASSSSSSPATTAAESYLYEDSPQHLIEQLHIDRSPPPSSSSAYSNSINNNNNSNKVAVNATKNRYSSVAPATNTQQQRARQSTSNKKKQSSASVKQQERKVDQRPLGIEELLLAGNSSGYSSSSDLSSSSASPRETLDDYWLMNDDHQQTEPASFYAISCANENDTSTEVSPKPSPPSSSSSEDQRQQRIKIEIENIAANGGSESTQPDDCALVKVSDIPKPATVNVFVPFTEEMDKGFLRLDDTGLTMLKEDPDDLTHLAPTAGDVCVPLDENHIDYVLPDMLEDIMLSDCHLLSNDGDRDLSSSSPNSFFSYNRDDLEPSSRPLSPILTQQNEDCSIPSFCSDDSPLHDSTVNHFLDFTLISPTDDIDDLSGKSPYIPLSLDQDPLLPFVTNDFMWGSSSAESSTWSSEPSSPTSNCSLSPRLDHTTSSLAKLLKADPICNYDGGGDSENRTGRASSTLSQQNGGGASKHAAGSFGNNVNSLADRNYSNVGNFKTVAYHRSVNLMNEMKRRTNSTVKKETCNNRSSTDDKRTKNGHITAGNKRTVSENSWGRGANSCKRSKQTSRTIIVNGSGGGGGGTSNNNNSARRMQQESAAMAEAVAAAKQTNSVLMNLLVSGCDLNAGYDEDFRETNVVRGVVNADSGGGGIVRYSNTSTPNKNLVSRVNNNNNNNNYQAKNNMRVNSLDSTKCWSQSKKKSVSLFDSESSHIPSLMDLTEQDYAVNAPSAGVLLQGSDLLKALECETVI